MHPTAFAYVRQAAEEYAAAEPPRLELRVLELGSRRDACGGEWVRRAFRGATQHLGIDKRAGHGVDVVADAATWRGDGLPAPDVVLCCEVFEHAPEWPRILENAAELVRPGGVLILTCAGPARAPHGVDGGELPAGEFYRPIVAAMLGAILEALGLEVLELVDNHEAGDVYATARRREELVVNVRDALELLSFPRPPVVLPRA